MRSTFSVLFLFFAGLMPVVAQNKLHDILPLEEGKVVYRQTVSVPGVSKDEVFRRARRWWVLTYKSAKDVLQLSDSSTGELIGKGYQTAHAPGEKGDMKIDELIYLVMALDAKENAYTLTVSQIKILRGGYMPGIPIEDYKRSPEKNLLRTLTGVDLAIKGNYESINQAVLTDRQ